MIKVEDAVMKGTEYYMSNGVEPDAIEYDGENVEEIKNFLGGDGSVIYHHPESKETIISINGKERSYWPGCTLFRKDGKVKVDKNNELFMMTHRLMTEEEEKEYKAYIKKFNEDNKEDIERVRKMNEALYNKV